MLAVLTDRRDFDDDWLFERKLDGVRVLAARHVQDTVLLSRNGKHLNATYPEIADALAGQPRED
ncbi:ATP-dependent DNA ligase, partial [Kitasatospora sp. NPDC056531]